MGIIDKPPNPIGAIRRRKVNIEVRNGETLIFLQCGHTRRVPNRVYRDLHRDYKKMRCTACEDAAFITLPTVKDIEVFAATK